MSSNSRPPSSGEPTPEALTATPGVSEALQLLIDGNERFLSGKKAIAEQTSPERLRELAQRGQKPFAVVLCCSDSRVPAEIIFDRGFGDLFMVRVAGNVVAPSLIASMELASTLFSTPILVVMGHTQCGAIRAAVQRSLSPERVSRNLRDLLDRVEPSVRAMRTRYSEEALFEPATLEKAETETIIANVRHSIRQIRNQSRVLRDREASGQLKIIGALFHMHTGKVQFDLGSEIPDETVQSFSTELSE